MANNFRKYVTQSIGTSAVGIGGYTVPAGTQVIALNTIITNVLVGTDISVDVYSFDGTTPTYLLKGAPIPAGGAIIIPKMVLVSGDSLRVKSSNSASVDATLSVLERT